MNNTQKIIKYLAIFFAISLIVSIFYSITIGVTSFFYIFGNDSEKSDINGKFSYTYERSEISYIDIDLKASSTEIKQGDTLKVEADNKNITFRKRGNKLYISEKDYHLFRHKNYKRNVIIYLPKDYIYEEISIDSGFGKINVDSLSTNKLFLDLGAGEVVIDELNVLDEAEIEGGAGKITINNGTINNLDLDMGVGKLELSSKLTGNSKVDAGVGETVINLIGKMEDYKIKIDKGIGEAKLNNNNIESSKFYGNGNNELIIDGGIGKIDITVDSDLDDNIDSESIDNNYSFEFLIDKYLKDQSGDIIVFGKIISGSATKDSNIIVLNNTNDIIASGKIKNKDVGLYQNEINTCSINENCAFIIENVSEEQLIDATKIVKAD